LQKFVCTQQMCIAENGTRAHSAVGQIGGALRLCAVA
jgi:hypothetical protein